MPDQSISALTTLAASAVADDDLLPVVDTSAVETKQINLANVRWALGLAKDKADVEAATFPSALQSITVLGRTEEGDGGFTFARRVVSAPAHGGYYTDAGGVVWEWSSPEVTPETSGAVGDGVADDLPALELARNVAAATGRPIRLGADKQYGISGPWQFNSSHSFVKVVGPATIQESDQSASFSVCTIKKLGTWVGDAAIIVNSSTVDPDVDPLCVALHFEGFAIDGNGQSGDGMQWWAGGRHYALRVTSYDHPTGWGFRVDGVFFPTYQNCVSRGNGTNGSPGSGGCFCASNTIRENADGKWLGGYMNSAGHRVLLFGERGTVRPEDAQTGWVFEDTELWFGGDAFDGANDAEAPFTAEIKGAWLSTFRRVKFIGGNSTQHAYCVLMSDSTGGAVEDLTFEDCWFQQSSFAAGPIVKFAIYFADPRGGTAGEVINLSINNAVLKGNSKLLKADDLASTDSILMNSPRIDPGDVSDADFIVQNLFGGLVGRRYGTADDTFSLTNRSEGGAISFQTTASTGFPGNTIVSRFLFGNSSHLVAESYWQYSFPVHRQSTKMTTAEVEAFEANVGFAVADEFWWTGGTAPSGTTGFTTAGKYICVSSGTTPGFEKMH